MHEVLGLLPSTKNKDRNCSKDSESKTGLRSGWFEVLKLFWEYNVKLVEKHS